jgi:hypothetical protein
MPTNLVSVHHPVIVHAVSSGSLTVSWVGLVISLAALAVAALAVAALAWWGSTFQRAKLGIYSIEDNTKVVSLIPGDSIGLMMEGDHLLEPALLVDVHFHVVNRGALHGSVLFYPPRRITLMTRNGKKHEVRVDDDQVRSYYISDRTGYHDESKRMSEVGVSGNGTREFYYIKSYGLSGSEGYLRGSLEESIKALLELESVEVEYEWGLCGGRPFRQRSESKGRKMCLSINLAGPVLKAAEAWSRGESGANMLSDTLKIEIAKYTKSA